MARLLTHVLLSVKRSRRPSRLPMLPAGRGTQSMHNAKGSGQGTDVAKATHSSGLIGLN